MFAIAEIDVGELRKILHLRLGRFCSASDKLQMCFGICCFVKSSSHLRAFTVRRDVFVYNIASSKHYLEAIVEERVEQLCDQKVTI